MRFFNKASAIYPLAFCVLIACSTSEPNGMDRWFKR
jgi:hypothetical protein